MKPLSGKDAAAEFAACARNDGATLSNFYGKDGEFTTWKTGFTSFLLERELGFSRLYYFARNAEELTRDLENALREGMANSRLIADVVGPDITRMPQERALRANGFLCRAVLQRMARKTPPAGIVTINCHSIDVYPANLGDIPAIKHLLGAHFDAESEQLPDERQIVRWVSAGTLPVVRFSEVSHEGGIAGFAAFDLAPSRLHLRYWFVHPLARGMGFGGALMHAVFAKGMGTTRQYLWVKTDNENAIARYRHYGFEFEALRDTVLAYEGENR